MIYIKVSAEDGTVTAIEAIENPIYVRWQESNETAVRCSEVKAQGVLSLDGSTTYQLSGKTAMPNVTLTAILITMAEYDNLMLDYEEPEDTEDTTPEVPEDTTEEKILTRAELTAKVTALEEELAAAKILLGVE